MVAIVVLVFVPSPRAIVCLFFYLFNFLLFCFCCFVFCCYLVLFVFKNFLYLKVNLLMSGGDIKGGLYHKLASGHYLP